MNLWIWFSKMLGVSREATFFRNKNNSYGQMDNKSVTEKKISKIRQNMEFDAYCSLISKTTHHRLSYNLQLILFTSRWHCRVLLRPLNCSEAKKPEQSSIEFKKTRVRSFSIGWLPNRIDCQATGWLDCQATFIRETGWNLKTRLTEHKRATK